MVKNSILVKKKNFMKEIKLFCKKYFWIKDGMYFFKTNYSYKKDVKIRSVCYWIISLVFKVGITLPQQEEVSSVYVHPKGIGYRKLCQKLNFGCKSTGSTDILQYCTCSSKCESISIFKDQSWFVLKTNCVSFSIN